MVTRIGCGHAGFTENEIGTLLYKANLGHVMPPNIILCPEFRIYMPFMETREFDISPLT